MLRHGVEAGRCSAALALVWLRALPNTALSWPRPVQNSPGNTRPGAQPVQNSPRNIPPAPQPVQNSPRNIPPAPQPVQNSPRNTPPAPQPVQNSPGNTRPAPQPVQNSPSNTRPGAQPVQNSPSNTPPAPQPVQNTPSTHKISKIQPFWTCRANFLSLIHHLGDNFHAADRHRLTVVHHHAHVAFCFFGPISCTLKVASHGVPLQGAHTGLIRTNSVHPVSTIKFPHTTTHTQIPTHPSTGQIPSGKLCTGLFGELERHTESAHS